MGAVPDDGRKFTLGGKTVRPWRAAPDLLLRLNKYRGVGAAVAASPREKHISNEFDSATRQDEVMVTLSSAAPVLPVSNVPDAMRRYELLGFNVQLYEGGEYAFASRDAVALHLAAVR